MNLVVSKQLKSLCRIAAKPYEILLQDESGPSSAPQASKRQAFNAPTLHRPCSDAAVQAAGSKRRSAINLDVSYIFLLARQTATYSQLFSFQNSSTNRDI